MGDLKASLSKDDIETLVEAMDDWEMIGNHEFHVMSAIKSAPMPPEDMEEHYDAMKRLKEVFKKREKEIKETRVVRQERAILTKAKLVLIKQDLGIGKLFDASNCTDDDAPVSRKKSKVVGATESELSALELAHEFIRDMGVQTYYNKFLVERGEKPFFPEATKAVETPDEATSESE